MKYASKSCKGSIVKAKFAAYFKEITFLLRICPWNAAKAEWGNGDNMLVWHEVFSVVHFLLVPAFKFHPPSSKL